MKKIIKICLSLFLIFCLFILGITLYIGNYFYDYTLNPASTKNISEKIEVNQEIKKDAKEWLDKQSEDVYIQSQDGLKLHGDFIDQKSGVYMIMIHGYRSDGSSIISPIKKMYKCGYNLLIPDLRGHGESEGDYIGMGWDDRKDIIQWIDYILSIDPQASIILYGVSMGGATVMNVSGEKLPHQVKAIIEDCGYTSAWDVIKTHTDMSEFQSEIALRMASFVTMIKAGYRLEDVQPIEQVKKSQTPILFIHGAQDSFIPVEMVKKLYNAASCPKEMLIITKGNHANSCAVDPQTYYRTIFEFIDKYK